MAEIESHTEPAPVSPGCTPRGRRHCSAVIPEAVDFRSVDYTRPCAIAVGNETEGAWLLAALADEVIMIPMMGLTESLTGAAAAVILYEAQRQRAEADT